MKYNYYKINPKREYKFGFDHVGTSKIIPTQLSLMSFLNLTLLQLYRVYSNDYYIMYTKCYSFFFFYCKCNELVLVKFE